MSTNSKHGTIPDRYINPKLIASLEQLYEQAIKPTDTRLRQSFIDKQKYREQMRRRKDERQ